MKFQVGESRPKKKKLFSNLVMWVEGTDHSHTFITWKDNELRRWIAEAKGSGVRIVSNIEFKKTAEVVNIYDYEYSSTGYNDLIDFVWENSTDKYGFKQIYGLLEMRIVNKICTMLGLKYRHKNRFTDGEYSQICCEFILRGIQRGTSVVYGLDNIEQFGLRETRNFNLSHGHKADKIRLDKINGVI